MTDAYVVANDTNETPIEDVLAHKLSYSKRYMRDRNAYNWEYGRLLTGKPITVVEKKNNLGENLIKPLSTGTLRATVDKLTRQVVQGAVSVDIKSAYANNDPIYKLIEYIVNNIILTDSTSSKANFTSKLRQVFRESLAYGFCPIYTAFEKDLSGEPVVKMKLRDYGNVFIEPDKDHISEINWCFTRLWYSKDDVDLMRDAWGNEICDAILKAGLDSKMGNSDERQTDDLNNTYAWQQGYPIFVYQEKNKNSDIIYYSERLNQVIYRHKNYDATGLLRTHFLINGQDSSGALGRSLFENLKAIQEAEDEELQLAHFATTLQLDPPLQVQGTADSPIVMRRGAVNWLQPGASVEPMIKNTNSPQVTASSMQMLSGIVTNETGIDDMSTPSTNNQAGISKTDTGVKAQQAILDTVTNMYDEEIKAFLATYIMNAFNVFVKYSKAGGVRKLAISDYETLRALQDYVIEDNYIEIPYDELTLEGVSINVGTSDYGTTTEKVEAVRYILNIINSSQGYNSATAGFVKSMVRMLNLDDSSEVEKSILEWENNVRQRQALNFEQQRWQIEQMKAQHTQVQKEQPLQDEQSKVQMIQGWQQEQLSPLQFEVQKLQLQVQIEQMRQQLAQANQPQQGGQ